MEEKELEKAREIIILVETYNFFTVAFICFAFTSIYLGVNIIIIYMLVIFIILLGITKYLHIKGWLNDE